MDRRKLLMTFPALAAGSTALSALAFNGYPNKPIRIICGSTAGALLDVATRLYAEKMTLELKQPLVVENVAGASSVLAARTVIRNPADGYTLLTAANTVLSMPHISAKAGYKVGDFTPIGEMARSPSVLIVSAESPFRTLVDVIKAAKANPGSITYASGGVGSVSHLASELFAEQANIKLVHVPYKGVAPAVTDAVANRVDLLMATPTSVDAMVKTGRLRMLAITSENRSAKYPDVPSFKELGLPRATFEVWVGMFAPANLLEPVRAALGRAMEVVRNDPQVQRKLEEHGQTISDLRTPDAFNAFVRADDASLGKLIRTANIRSD